MSQMFALLLALLNYGATGCISLQPDYPDRLAIECETIKYAATIDFDKGELTLVEIEVTDFGVDHVPIKIVYHEKHITFNQAKQIIRTVSKSGIEPYFCSVVELNN